MEVHHFLLAAPVHQIGAQRCQVFLVEGLLSERIAQLGATMRDLRPDDALVHRFVQVHHRLADDDLVRVGDGEIALQPLLRGQNVIGRFDGEGRGVHVQMADHLHLVDDLGQLPRVADHRMLVARALHPVARLVRLACGDGLEHRGDVRMRPDAQALVLAIP